MAKVGTYFSKEVYDMLRDPKARFLFGSGSGSSFVTSLTTTGTSGAASVVAGVLNIPQYGGGTVTSVSNVDGSITVTTGTTAAVVSLNTANANNWTAARTTTFNNIGATATDAIILTNTTASTAVLNQFAPSILFNSTAWKTNATAASQTVAMRLTMTGITTATSAFPYMGLTTSINGAAYTNWWNVSSSGIIQATPCVSFQTTLAGGMEWWSSGGGMAWRTNAGNMMTLNGNLISLLQPVVTGSRLAVAQSDDTVNSLQVTGPSKFNGAILAPIVTTAAGTYTILATDHTVIATGTTSTWTFPTATTGRILVLVNHGSGAVTLGTAVTTANATTTTTIAAAGRMTIQYDSTVWRQIAA